MKFTITLEFVLGKDSEKENEFANWLFELENSQYHITYWNNYTSLLVVLHLQDQQDAFNCRIFYAEYIQDFRLNEKKF